MTVLSVRKSNASDPALLLAPGAVHLWLCRVELQYTAVLLHNYRALLSAQELERCDAIRNPVQSLRAVLARVLVRTTLSRYAPVEPSQWCFGVDSHNKPRVSSPDCEFSFNLSHSGQWLVCAVGLGADLGVDIERHKPERDHLRLAQRYFDPAEARALQLMEGEQRIAYFYDFWTLKEAWLKATGLGLSGGLDKVVFQFEAGGGLNVEIPPGRAPVSFRSWRPDSKTTLSLCYPAAGVRPPPVKIFAVEPLAGYSVRELDDRLCSEA